MTTEPLRRVFLAPTLEKLVALLEEQGDEALQHSDIEIPVRATPIVLLLAKNGPLTAADVARELNEPHQLVTQRVDLLLALKLISRTADPNDARRKLISITKHGKAQLLLLKERLNDVELLFAAIFEELGFDLQATAAKMIEALERSPLLERGLAFRKSRRK